MHKLLERQLRKVTDGSGRVDIAALAELVSGAYGEMEQDRDRTDRSLRLMADELEWSNKQLLDAINTIPVGIFLLDANNRFVLWNEHYADLSRKQGVGVKLGDTYPDMLRSMLRDGWIIDAIGREMDWLAERLEVLRQPSSTVEVHVRGERWIRVDQRRTAGGGTAGIRVDITDLKQREETTRLLFEQNPLPLWVTDLETFRLLDVNQAMVDHYGYTREELLNMTLIDLRPMEEQETFRQIIRERRWARGDAVRRHVRKDGSEILVNVFTRPIVHDGREAWLTSMIDVTEREGARRQIEYLADHDLLTGLPNRAAFLRHLAEAVVSTKGDDTFAVVSLDLDRFREINDVFGHASGDELLRVLAARLEAAAQGTYLARLSGDEFCLINDQGAQPASAERLANRLQRTVAEAFHVNGRELRTGMSIGIAFHPLDGTDAETLLANASAALQRVKHEQRGAIRFFEPAMDDQIRERRSLTHELGNAVAAGELYPHYQPQALTDGTVVGFEALARWSHPRKGPIPPSLFIPIAEESGLILEIGEQLLREVCREATSWARPLRIGINLSPVQFRYGDLPATVHSILLETGLAPGRLELEVTEGVLIADSSRAVSTLNRLKALGIRIAMDDFGTGYSSLSYLQAFPFDRIKIDRGFVAKLFKNQQSAPIIRAVIGLARGLSLPVTAEGVETEEQLAFLRAEDCDEVQGFLIGRPGPIDTYSEVVGRDPAPVHRTGT